MKKIVIGLVGVILFFLSLLLWFSLQQGEKKAIALDNKKKGFAEIGEDAPPFCSWKAYLPNRVISENKSQVILINITNAATKKCASTLSLNAPAFSMSPSKAEQSIELPSHGKGTLSWIMTPIKSGTFDITLSDMVNTQVVGITVTNIFGFSPFEASLFSVFGTIFGPMLTFPWWWEKLRKSKS